MKEITLENLSNAVNEVRNMQNGRVSKWPDNFVDLVLACIEKYGYSKVSKATKISLSCLHTWKKGRKTNLSQPLNVIENQVPPISITEISHAQHPALIENKPIAILRNGSVSLELYSNDFLDLNKLKHLLH